MRSVLVTAVVLPLLILTASAPVAANSHVLPTSNPSIVPPLNTAVLKDPSGTYTFAYLGNRQYETNLTAYEKLLSDPYSGVPATNVQVTGSSVIITTGQTDVVSTPTDLNGAWSGAGGGDCSSFSVSNGGSICNSSSGSLGTSGVCTGACEGTLTWDAKCWSGSSCVSSYWTGLSGNNTNNYPLIQNGINVCENHSGCPSGGSKGKMTWDMWWTILSQYSSDQVISSYPTTINGTNYEFNIAFVNSKTQPTFVWTVGSWTYSLTVSSNYPQIDFWQSEGVIEPPVVSGTRVVITEWSANPVGMSGWWETGQWCGCTYNSGYYGTSYTSVLYEVLSSGGSNEAYGSLTGASTFSDTWT